MSLRRLLFVYETEYPDSLLESQFDLLSVQIDATAEIEDATRRARTTNYDLIVVAARTDSVRGRKLCTEVRLLTTAPIILIAPMEQEEEIFHALQQDVDVVLPTTVSAGVVAGHVAALLRRVKNNSLGSPANAAVSSQYYEDGCVSIDLIRRRVLLRGQKIRFTPTEFRLLSLLVRHPDQVLTYDQILNQVWGWEVTDHRIVHTFVAQVRAKFGAVGAHYFINEYGVGYRFTPKTSV